jgi:type I restriction enzyme R subunit/putative DNA methylase
MDRFLDQASCGPTWLKRSEVASIDVDAIRFGEEKLRNYDLHAWAVMSNHVHMLITPRIPVPKLMQALKGLTAREANRILSRTGEAFWQHESYDHWVRDSRQFERIARYIEDNPVQAGLCPSPADYRFSSAYAGEDAGMASLKARST